MSIFNVSTTSQLTAALATAKSGDSILVASGTYSGINLKNINPAGNVLITSANSSNPAVFRDVMLSQSKNLTFSHLSFNSSDGVNPSVSPFQVLSSTNIHLDHLTVSGPALGNAAVASGLMIRWSDGVSVTNSEFSNLQHGIEILDNTHLNITHNSFHDLRTDGIRGGADSNVLIAQNFFTDFHPAVGDHPDAIQFWTTNTLASAHDITITGNSVIRGSGAPVQGIFLRDQVGNLPYANIAINNNIVAGGMYNGIYVTGASGVDISKNIVVAFPDEKSWIRADSVTNLVVSSNLATSYVLPTPGYPAGNQLIQSATDGGAAYLQFWLTTHELPGNLIESPDAFVAALGLSTVGEVSGGFSHQLITLSGTDGADRITADPTFNTHIFGLAGSDTLTGNGVGSTLNGGAGDDTYIVKGLGDVVVEAVGAGYDTVASQVDYTLSANVESLRLVGDSHIGNGNELDNRLVGGAGNDTLHGLLGNDLIQGGAGDDALYGDGGNDDLRGEAGADQLWGGDGNDILAGGDGADTLNGGAGDDIIEGGAGNDRMWGGPGNDLFRFRDDVVAAHDIDQIFDFLRGADLIDLRAIDAKSTTATNDAFTYIGGQAFHHLAGELQVKAQGDGMIVSGDVNGDGVADFSIIVHGLTSMSASDFIL